MDPETFAGAATMSHAALPPDPHATKLSALVCLECGRRSAAGRGWRAYLYEGRELYVYCRECAAREFDDEA